MQSITNAFQQFLWYLMSIEWASLAAIAESSLTNSFSFPGKLAALRSDSPADSVLTLNNTSLYAGGLSQKKHNSLFKGEVWERVNLGCCGVLLRDLRLQSFAK